MHGFPLRLRPVVLRAVGLFLLTSTSMGCFFDWDPTHLPPAVDVSVLDATDVPVLDGADVSVDAHDAMDVPSHDGEAGGDCSACTAAQSCCNGQCINVDHDPDHCGDCTTACTGTTCSGGSCTSACRSGFLDCDSNVVNGCEVNAATDNANCGACAHACPTGRSCQAGACVCATGTADCDSNPTNGCETMTATDSEHCGGCTTRCATGQACVAGSCGCGANTADCDHDAANGCETDTSTDETNCGACGHACAANEVCAMGACACRTGQLRCPPTAADCTVSATDPANCGACGNTCPMARPVCGSDGCSVGCTVTGETRCGLSCVDLQADHDNCGTCGTACVAGQSCNHGMCACTSGHGDCDHVAANGCEADVTSDAANCGACGTACAAGQLCTGGACGCPTGQQDCGGGRCAACCNDGQCNDGNGCTTDTCSAAGTCTHAACGTGTVCCGLSCRACCGDADCASAGPHRGCGTDNTCSTCAAGFSDCNGLASDGCETALGTVTDCNGCGSACSFANAVAACSMGTCRMVACAPGFADCDRLATNGCETNLNSSASNCGACGTVCTFAGAEGACSGGTCVRSSCIAPMGDCDGIPRNGCETDLSSSPANCGACGNVCSFANATAGCNRGACQLGSCTAGFGNCDSVAANGCETNLGSSPANCGTCGHPCSFPNATPLCTTGTCAMGACASGFANCDSNPANGCETPTSTITNCGACGAVCPGHPNAVPSCSAGLCGYTCAAGFGDCDGVAANGCETDLRNTASRCGACTTTCGAGTACSNGTCSPAVATNNLCSGATALSMAGVGTTVNGTTTGTHVESGCSATPATAGDVYFSFTLPDRELVYFDTYGSAFDTEIGIAANCTAAPTCEDDSCSTVQSQVVQILGPGTFYLVVSGYTTTGAYTLHFQHMPTGNGTPVVLPQGRALTLSGATSGVGTTQPTTCTAGIGTGPETAYYYTTCPSYAGGTLDASFCAPGTASFDTVMYLRQGNGVETCNDDACSLQSHLVTTVTPGAALRALYVDGFNASYSGTYTMAYSTP